VDIKAVWKKISASEGVFQVVVCRGQDRPTRFGTVRAFPMMGKREADAAERREDAEYEYIVGYFDGSGELSDFREECLAQCEKVREVEQIRTAEDAALFLFQSDGTHTGRIRLCQDEHTAPQLDVRQWWPQNPDNRHTAEYAAHRGGAEKPAQRAGGGDCGEVRDIPGERCDGPEPGEGTDDWDWFGYL